jgi:hypothetical protein
MITVQDSVRSIVILRDIQSLFQCFNKRERNLIIPLSISVLTSQRTIIARRNGQAIMDLSDKIEKQKPSKECESGGPSRQPDLKISSRPDEGPCWHCNRIPPKEKAVGIPIRMYDDHIHNLIIADIEGNACNYSCAYSFLDEHESKSVFGGRIIILKKIFEIAYPGQVLIPAPHIRRLKRYGGELTDDEFDNGARFFHDLPSLCYRLCSVAYESSKVAK